MNRAVVFVFVACCALSALSLAQDEQESVPYATVVPAEEFSPSALSPSTTTTTTTEPTTTTTTTTTTEPTTTTTTTTEPTTTTTASTTTTTTKPTTTTTASTTTASTASTTTASTASTTTASTANTTTTTATTTAPPPPPPEPTPSANLTVGNYSVKTDKNVTCLIAHMALRIRVATAKINGTFLVQPNNTKAVGGCKDDKANLTLQFNEGYITFMFNKSAGNKTVQVNALSFKISYAFDKGAPQQYQAKNESVQLFSAKVGHSYSCRAESLYMGQGLYLEVDKDRLQAFNLTKAEDFGIPDHCRADQPDYRVAIGVGVTLLVLIVIVVVAYILSRRRRTDGYQSL